MSAQKAQKSLTLPGKYCLLGGGEEDKMKEGDRKVWKGVGVGVNLVHICVFTQRVKFNGPMERLFMAPRIFLTAGFSENV